MKDFYVRFYVGHRGKYGQESLEFEFRPEGLLKYSNNTSYRNEKAINKEVYVNEGVMKELERIVVESTVMECDDANWPMPDREGRQELEILLNDEHISFATNKISTLSEVSQSADPDGVRTFYYLIQDLKCLVFSLISMHFKVQPI